MSQQPTRTKQIGKVMCAWCAADLGEKEGVKEVSHGICGVCKESERRALRCERKEVPAGVLDEETLAIVNHLTADRPPLKIITGGGGL